VLLLCGGGLLGFAHKSRTDRDRAVTRLAEVGLPTDPNQIKHIPDPEKDAGALLTQFEVAYSAAKKTPVGRTYVSNRRTNLKARRDFINANPELVRLRTLLFTKTELATQIDPSQGYEQEFPRWAAYKITIDLAISEASIFAADSKPVEALDLLAEASSFAKVSHTDPTEFGETLGMSRANMLNRDAARIFSANADRSDVQAAMQRYVQQSFPNIDLRHALANEVACAIVLERNLNSGKIELSGLYSDGHDYELSIRDRATNSLFRIKGVYDVLFTRVYNGLSELYQTIPSDNNLHNQRIESAERWERIVEGLSGPDAHLLLMLGPRYSHPLKAEAKLKAEWRSLNALLVASEIKAKTGRYPSTLPVTGKDAIDPFTDKPLKYLVKGGKLTIYSVGQDLSDDNGLLFLPTTVSSSAAPPPTTDTGFSIPYDIPARLR
jgi:hypothetical protein